MTLVNNLIKTWECSVVACITIKLYFPLIVGSYHTQSIGVSDYTCTHLGGKSELGGVYLGPVPIGAWIIYYVVFPSRVTHKKLCHNNTNAILFFNYLAKQVLTVLTTKLLSHTFLYFELYGWLDRRIYLGQRENGFCEYLPIFIQR